MSQDCPNPLADLEQRLAYAFTNQELLFQALCHGSHSGDSIYTPVSGNQRLEFLGDAVLGLAVGHLLMEQYPDAREGELSRMRAGLVSEPGLAALAKELQIGPLILLSRGEMGQRGFEKDSILADCFEAIMGAIYLDGGLEAAFGVIRELVGKKLPEKPALQEDSDCKSRLQEICQKRWHKVPEYESRGESGPEHDKIFSASVTLANSLCAIGQGRSKKAAEQDAACQALLALEQES
jgi:ribonuclease III